MSEQEIAKEYLAGRFDRRTLIRHLLGAGFTLTAAASFADQLGSPAVATAAPASHKRPVVTKVHPGSGTTEGGTHVTIHGHHLKHGKVHFGSKRAHVLSHSATKLVVKTPSEGAGDVDVTVHTTHGTSNVNHDSHFKFIKPKSTKPDLTSISPNHGPSSGGTSVTIHGHHFRGVTNVKFGTASGSVTSSSSGTVLKVLSPPGNGTVDVRVTTPGGTTAITQADKFTYDNTGGGCASCTTCSTCATCSCVTCACESCVTCSCACSGCCTADLPKVRGHKH